MCIKNIKKKKRNNYEIKGITEKVKKKTKSNSDDSYRCLDFNQKPNRILLTKPQVPRRRQQHSKRKIK